MNQTIADIQNSYETVGPYYLTDFYKPNGNKHLYDFLVSVYQPRYQNNFRIIVVQDCPDIYDYQDLPGLAICTLQKYASQIDISNFFILVVTNNKNIEHELEQARQLYSTDDFAIQSKIVNNAEYVVAENNKQDTFCIMPWIHLYIGPDSNILPCCVADQQYPLGSINKQSIDEILKSTRFNSIRKNMLNGKRSKECNRCYSQEDAGLPSARQFSNREWGQYKTSINPNGELEEFKPVYLDIRLNNICNLKCRMCSGYFSSAIAQEDSKLFGNQTYLDTKMGLTEKSVALDELMDYLPYAKKIYFAGGEPLLAPEHYKMLDALIESNNTNIKISYNTNFTSLTYKGRSVIDLWKNFTNISVGASLDAIGSVAEYVRHGTKWQVIESNLINLKAKCPHVDFTVDSSVSFLTVSSLIELQKTWHENKTLDISKFTLSTVIDPDYLTAQVLPQHHKQRLSSQITTHIEWCKQNRAIQLATQWNSMLNFMMSKDNSHMLSTFKNLTIQKDQFRNESFAAIFPEFSDLL